MKGKAIIFVLTFVLSLAASSLAQGNNTNPAKLLVGDDAPAFKVVKWIKGGGHEGLPKGKVYVIDLWATWCVPCIASMPHLSRLQEKYKDKGVEVIGITSEDKYGNSLQKIEDFVRRRDTMMRYSVALVPISISKDSLQGIFVYPWMQRIGSMNLPTAFIVDRSGRIAYIGDPHTIDKPLDDVVNNTQNIAALRADYLDALKAAAVLDTFSAALNANQTNEAIAAGNKILHDFKYVKPNTYLVMADGVSKSKINNPDLLDIGVTAGKRGVMLTQFESPGFLSALASVYGAKGDYIQAVIAIKLAITLSEGEMREAEIKDMEKYLSFTSKKTP